MIQAIAYDLQWWILFGAALLEGLLVIIALFCIAYELKAYRLKQKGSSMPILSGLPMVTRLVKNGSGGPNKDSIPVYEDLAGAREAYLKNDTVIKIVDPAYPGISKYRKTHVGTTWVSFIKADGSDFIPGQESWCEETGHLIVVSDPIEIVQLVEYEVIEERVTNGRKFIKLKRA